tara:strand:+ start:2382 stop:3146 length:765 start_codon:yes stop_codon:yes gene_type:complete
MNLLQIERREHVAVLTFNDPDRRNVVSSEMNKALLSAFDDLEPDKDIKAVVLTGSGAAFCAGAILDDLLEVAEDKGGALPDIYAGFLRVAHSPLATIAAVNGPAVGAGMNMVLACDLVIAGKSAKFDTRFLDIGIHPGGGHTWRLRNISDLATAKAMVLFGQILSGEEAAHRGIAWECVDNEDLLETAISYAERASGFPKDLFAITKKTLHETATITESVKSVELELAPQRWSMQQPAFVNMVSQLKARIEKKN